ncbi:SAM-dependent methyltransferase [Undibacterium sp. FT137W]|uniref:SAM-dependent methyltransferase n=1 Tax=Undibacterium fentianense TaxID=2828728 RepID=A0A941IEQ8_9BURK|nr:SAM-dependent methyltransferase [Undibacterium fentianense]
MNLPQPSEAALANSQQLLHLIQSEIDANNGCIAFSRYMELALYTPRLGYYSGGSTKLGVDGDFTTAPEISSLFGSTLAQTISQLFQQTSHQIIEFGAGTGKLAFDILSECQLSNISINRYFIVELSGELRARQEERLKNFPEVVWLDQMPTEFTGVIIGNEVLDAMPVELIVKANDAWQVLGVCRDAQQTTGLNLTPMPDSFAVATELVAQIPFAAELPANYITEVHPISLGFMRSIAAMMQQGKTRSGLGSACIWIDYGFPSHEYYLAQRERGTLMCHYRHHAHPDPFYLPGLQDITAHVDFTAVAVAGVQSGLDLLSYTSQASFLLASGITDILSRIPIEDNQRYLPAANATQKLTSPAEMGELFKVLILGCGIELDDALATKLLPYDRSHRL